MSVFELVFKQIKARPLSALLSVLLVMLSIGTATAILNLQQQAHSQLVRQTEGVDMVLGANGSPLQLILSAVYHIDYPTGNIDWQQAQKIMKNPLIKASLPLAYGDSYKGSRIVGSIAGGATSFYKLKLTRGQEWQKPFEVTLGAEAAHKLNLKIGDEFESTHGLQQEGGTAHDHRHLTVTGIYEPSGTVADRLIHTGLQTVWQTHQQEDIKKLEAKDTLPNVEESKEITAVLLTFKTPMAMMVLPRMIKEKNMQAALPAIELNRLLSLTDTGTRFMYLFSQMILVVAGISIFVSLYQSLSERRYEMALLRTLGASRSYLFLLVLTEGFLISVAGVLCGWLTGRIFLTFVATYTDTAYGLKINSWHLAEGEWQVLLISLLPGLVAGAITGWQAYRLSVSKVLATR